MVDDGSTDGTAQAAAAAGATVLAHRGNRGLGAAVRTGLAAAVRRDPAAVAFLDADGEYAPEELGLLVAPILAGQADYVAGSRFAGMPRRMLPHRWVGNRVLTIGVRAVVRRWAVYDLTDAQSGYRALSPEAAAAAEIVHDFNYAQVLTLDLLAKGFRYAEVPDQLRLPAARPVVRAPGSLPAPCRAGRVAGAPRPELGPGGRRTRRRGRGPVSPRRRSGGTRRAGPARARRRRCRRAVGRRRPPTPWPGRGACCRA